MADGRGMRISSSPLAGEDKKAWQLVCLAAVGEGAEPGTLPPPSPSFASGPARKLRYPLPQGERIW
jgi:hypothetical protein